MRLEGKKALITGAASGIGKAVAEAFQKEGAQVIAADRDFPKNDTPAADGMRVIHLDVTSERDWEALFISLPRIDAFVGCAGISEAVPLAETTLSDWKRVMDVNLNGAFLSLRYAAKAMREKGGAIVIVGSASGIKAAPGASAYCASKAGARMLVKTAALELKPHAIRVNCVSPAGVVTPMWKKMPFWPSLVEQHGSEEAAWNALGGADPATPSIQRMAFPEEIASAIVFLASDESAHITGADLVIDGGFTL